MKVIMMNGGLGNQMFKYIFFRFIEIVSGDDCCIEDHHFYHYDEHNGYELERIFGVKPKTLKDRFAPAQWQEIVGQFKETGNMMECLKEHGVELTLFSESDTFAVDAADKKLPLYRGSAYIFNGSRSFFVQDVNPFRASVPSTRSLRATLVSFCPSFVLDLIKKIRRPMRSFLAACFPERYKAYLRSIYLCDRDMYYYGYWVNLRWFQYVRKEILQELVFPPFDEGDVFNPDILKQIQSSQSVSVHVRRGDFLLAGVALDASSYTKCVAKMRRRARNPVFFLFSDDLLWCRQNKEALGFREDDKLVFVDGNTG